MGKEFQKSALPTLFHFVWVRAALQPRVPRIATATAAVAVEAQLRQQSLQRKLCMKCLMVVGQALGCLLCDESATTDTCEDLIPPRSNEGWQASKKGKS